MSGAGRLSTTTYPNGVVATNGYNNADRLTSVTNAKGSTFSSFTYTLDGVGNRTQVVANNGTTTFAYDNLYRLTSVTYPGPTTDTYSYDALGNRLTKNATSYTYDSADQLTAAGGVSYGYDGSGNQTSRGSDTYAFDHDHRMTQAVSSGVTSSSVYYGNGVRKSHTVNGVTTSYKYDVLASLPVVIQDGTYSYVYGLDLISMTDGSGNQKYLSYDGLGSVTDITDGAGTVTDTFVYDVFGAVKARTGASATAWKFTGEQADDASGDSGYYFLRARYYDTATGRFTGRDKLEFSQRYAYAGNNPALYIDRSGRCPECDVAFNAVFGGSAQHPLGNATYRVDDAGWTWVQGGYFSGRVDGEFGPAHPAIDIPGARPVFAAVWGAVIFAGQDTGSDSCPVNGGPQCSSLVVIQLFGGLQIGIRHMSGLSVRAGDLLVGGELLGMASDIGSPGKKHFHGEVAPRVIGTNGGRINPIEGLPKVEP